MWRLVRRTEHEIKAIVDESSEPEVPDEDAKEIETTRLPPGTRIKFISTVIDGDAYYSNLVDVRRQVFATPGGVGTIQGHEVGGIYRVYCDKSITLFLAEHGTEFIVIGSDVYSSDLAKP